MRPELFALPLPFKTIPIYSYGFMVMAGFVAGIFISVRRARTIGVNPNYIMDLGLWTMVSGIAGARVLYVSQFHDRFDWSLFRIFGDGFTFWTVFVGALLGSAFGWFREKHKRKESGGESRSTLQSMGKGGLLRLLLFVVLGGWLGHIAGNLGALDFEIFRIDKGGLVYYGGLIGAASVGLLYLWRKGAPVWAVADCVSPALALGLAFGRVGCFLNGCCWGRTCQAFFAVSFPSSYAGVTDIPNPVFSEHLRLGLVTSEAQRSLSVHPTQIYSSLGAFLLFLFLCVYYPKRRGHGEVFSVFALLYGVHRFTVESFRADNDAFMGGMTISQNISIGVFVVGLCLFLYHRFRSRPEAASGLAPATRE